MSVKVFGISMVRNEVDIIRVNGLHHLSLGLEPARRRQWVFRRYRSRVAAIEQG